MNKQDLLKTLHEVLQQWHIDFLEFSGKTLEDRTDRELEAILRDWEDSQYNQW